MILDDHATLRYWSRNKNDQGCKLILKIEASPISLIIAHLE